MYQKNRKQNFNNFKKETNFKNEETKLLKWIKTFKIGKKKNTFNWKQNFKIGNMNFKMWNKNSILGANVTYKMEEDFKNSNKNIGSKSLKWENNLQVGDIFLSLGTNLHIFI